MSAACHARAIIRRAAGLATLAAVLVSALPLPALADEYEEQRNRTATSAGGRPDFLDFIHGQWLSDYWFVPALVGALLFVYFVSLRRRWARRRQEEKRRAAQRRAAALGGVFGGRGQRGGE